MQMNLVIKMKIHKMMYCHLSLREFNVCGEGETNCFLRRAFDNLESSYIEKKSQIRIILSAKDVKNLNTSNKMSNS